MKSKALAHVGFLLVFLALTTAIKGWFDLTFLPYWIGGLVGIFLPDIDHLIYVYYLRPHEVTSQRAANMLNNQEFTKAGDLLASTSPERKNLIFHTAHFQIIFVAFAFLVVSSSANLLGRGIVLGFLLHLLVDQLEDLRKRESLEGWFMTFKINLEKEQATFYWVANMILLIVFGFIY